MSDIENEIAKLTKITEGMARDLVSVRDLLKGILIFAVVGLVMGFIIAFIHC